MNTTNALSESSVTYNSVHVDGLDIFYREAGPKDAPVLLLLHGVPTSSRMYQPMLESILNTKYRLIAPDYPGFGHSSWPNPTNFPYTFDHIAQVMQDFADRLELDHYTLFLHDYGGPIGMRMAMAHPEKIQALIIQNAVSHEEGLSPIWASRKQFWRDRAGQEAAMRESFLSLESTRNRHLGSSPNPERIDPDTWVDEWYFLSRAGQGDIQMDLFFDYQTNLKAYPSWQKWLRDHRPPMLVLWGKYDLSFTVAGAQAYRREVPGAEVHILEAGHFALDEKPDEIISLTDSFMSHQSIR
ncbi:MAG TPA: alpha/beta hydrolase [Verrucomicrobiae bacterium]|nr:alpha/beta hydrolase [Verrucomicrobiae bacterium]